ncbi:MAG: Lrp/AsnC family transcriptional regulator [Porticoccaceae bacterium]|nr:Lrp/AsnC family transcriptional regulator [Porticoccaceae bacterium]MBT5577234.1 Lrp/AsnC family transcriptional regulator [Porticoccaceae bacterium]MBT7376431.1 Lrp/AsnC family transcriptional regulator [Porticoccaceae bacterium]
MNPYKLDSTDWKILNILQSDAGISNIELADKVCLSPSPCSRRVKNLEQLGYISRRVSIIDPQKAGLPVTVFVQVTLHHQVKKDLDRFAKQVVDWPEVMECYLMTGDFDYLMRVVTPDLQGYQEFLDKKLTQVEGIEHIKSSFSLKPICYKTELPLDHLT